MKKYYVLLLSLLMYSSALFAKTTGILLQNVEISPIFTELSPISYFNDALNYTEGGITFVYGSGIFTQTPCVNITVELLDAIETMTDVYVATVTYNDANSIGVVAKHINNIIEEATTNSVRIHLAATGS